MFLTATVCAKSYKELAIELVAMEECGMDWRCISFGYADLARILTDILGWDVKYRKLRERMNDCTYKRTYNGVSYTKKC